MVWSEGAADYFEAGDPGTEKTTLEELRACPHMANMTREQLEESHTEAENLIMEADCERLGALKWLAMWDDGTKVDDGFLGFTEDELRDCTFMDGMTREELEGLLARARATIREAGNQRMSALKRLNCMAK